MQIINHQGLRTHHESGAVLIGENRKIGPGPSSRAAVRGSMRGLGEEDSRSQRRGCWTSVKGTGLAIPEEYFFTSVYAQTPFKGP